MSDSQTTMPITATVDGFAKISGLGRSSIYRLLKSGKIKGVMVLERRLIIVSSYLEYIEKIKE